MINFERCSLQGRCFKWCLKARGAFWLRCNRIITLDNLVITSVVEQIIVTPIRIITKIIKYIFKEHFLIMRQLFVIQLIKSGETCLKELYFSNSINVNIKALISCNLTLR